MATPSNRYLVEFKQWSAAGKPSLCRNVIYGRDIEHALETFRNRRPDREVTYVWQDVTPESVRKFQKSNRKALDRVESQGEAATVEEQASRCSRTEAAGLQLRKGCA